MKAPNLFTAACLLAFCGYASAYTLNGTVTTKDGKAIQGADVKLVKKNKATTTDEQGKFTFKEESAHLNAVRSAGSFSLTNGVLNFSQRYRSKFLTWSETRYSHRPCRVRVPWT